MSILIFTSVYIFVDDWQSEIGDWQSGTGSRIQEPWLVLPFLHVSTFHRDLPKTSLHRYPPGHLATYQDYLLRLLTRKPSARSHHRVRVCLGWPLFLLKKQACYLQVPLAQFPRRSQTVQIANHWTKKFLINLSVLHQNYSIYPKVSVKTSLLFIFVAFSPLLLVLPLFFIEFQSFLDLPEFLFLGLVAASFNGLEEIAKYKKKH